MKTNLKANQDASHQKIAKLAGITFLVNLFGPTLLWFLVSSKLLVTDDILATSEKVLSKELLFRASISIELILSIGLMVLGLTLYLLTKKINKNLALLGFMLKMAEGIIAAVIVVVSVVALQILKSDAEFSILSIVQKQFPVGLILNSHAAIWSIPMIFLGLDMIIFSYLFLKSNYIPKSISILGIIAFTSILIYAVFTILAPEISVIFLTIPSFLFELIIGIWLLLKGVNNIIPESDGK